MADHTVPAPKTAAAPAETMDAGISASKQVWVRAIIYIVSGHVFVAFLFLLFYLGSRGH
ncbi:DUF6126 family protein [Kitasatospora sp. NPDC049285]|uniref:DUF6126 family protein n=1 Tax=Kitasatospora sp. NPDC049285 TaxID=3157096 RepID=UPI00342FEC33